MDLGSPHNTKKQEVTSILFLYKVLHYFFPIIDLKCNNPLHCSEKLKLLITSHVT